MLSSEGVRFKTMRLRCWDSESLYLDVYIWVMMSGGEPESSHFRDFVTVSKAERPKAKVSMKPPPMLKVKAFLQQG